MTKLIVFDTETTCLDYEKLEIWQLSGDRKSVV